MSIASRSVPVPTPGTRSTFAELGLPALRLSDGPNGVRGPVFDGAPSVCFPAASALGATWDIRLVEDVGRALAAECRRKGAGVLLAPTVNLQRYPLGGRNFEMFSEDPHVTSRLAVAYIEGLQRSGIGACVKHFVGNESEHERHTMSSDIDERTLREVYLRPFEAAVREADVWAVMSAYNRLNGTPTSDDRWLLTGAPRRLGVHRDRHLRLGRNTLDGRGAASGSGISRCLGRRVGAVSSP